MGLSKGKDNLVELAGKKAAAATAAFDDARTLLAQSNELLADATQHHARQADWHATQHQAAVEEHDRNARIIGRLDDLLS